MESLKLPTGGAVYVDANAIIYSVERVEPYRSLLAPMWEEARAGRFNLASSELVALETLIRPLRDGNARLEMLFRSILTAAEIELIPATLTTWEDAARIRAETAWRHPTHSTPQQLCALAALPSSTNDTDFRRVDGLPVVVLDDLVESEA